MPLFPDNRASGGRIDRTLAGGHRLLALMVMTSLAACVPAQQGGAVKSAPARAPFPAAPAASLPAPQRQAAPLPHIADFHLLGRAVQGGAMRGHLPPSVRALALQDQTVSIAADRQFLLAFDRDAPATTTLTATMNDGRIQRLALTVAEGDWRIERVNTPLRGASASSAEFQRRRPAELAQIAAARAEIVQSDGWRQRFVWPVKGRFSGFFGSQRIYQGVSGSYHGGTDVAVSKGTPFVAPADGVVVLAAQNPFTLEGRLLIVAHGMGLNSAFLHCEQLDVKVGDVVRQGDRLGTVGATGRATGPHMHWGMKWGAARIDPGLLTSL